MQRQAESDFVGSILTPSGWVRGRVEFEGGRIASVSGERTGADVEPAAPYVIPGFIDLHVHCGGGHTWRGGHDAIRGLARFHGSLGTVALAPTTATAPANVIEDAIGTIKAVKEAPRPGEAAVLGTHLEGPFINPRKLGAQEPEAIDGDPTLATRWADIGAILIATVAPEIPGGLEVIAALSKLGCKVQIAHSLATAAEAAEGFGQGCTGFTHLFNAMSGVDHRAPGVAAYALAHGTFAEIIVDLLHVHPEVVRAAYRAIPKLYAISDSTMAGWPDGPQMWGGHAVVKTGLRVTLADGTLAGSAVTMLDCFRNLVGLGMTVAEAAAMTSGRQAEYLGRADLGRIAPGAPASLVRLGEDLRLEAVMIDGHLVQQSAEG